MSNPGKLIAAALLVSAALVLATTLTPHPSLAQADGLVWLERYDDAVQLSKQSGKPIFLEFR